MKARKNNRKIGELSKAKDMLGLMVDKEADKDNINYKDSSVLSMDEITGNCILFITAGVDAMHSVIQTIVYILCAHPEVQEKLVAEIDTIILPGDTIQYEYLSQLKYTGQGIQECLRLYPPLFMLFRVSAETKTYNGITIPKGTVVSIPVGNILKDPEYFPEPDKFDPDRFSPSAKSERDHVAFLSFSYGPRFCVAQRFAMMELKVFIAILIKELQFSLSDRTEPKKGDAMKKHVIAGTFLRQFKPVVIEVKYRNGF